MKLLIVKISVKKFPTHISAPKCRRVGRSLYIILTRLTIRRKTLIIKTPCIFYNNKANRYFLNDSLYSILFCCDEILSH